MFFVKRRVGLDSRMDVARAPMARLPAARDYGQVRGRTHALRRVAHSNRLLIDRRVRAHSQVQVRLYSHALFVTRTALEKRDEAHAIKIFELNCD